jgi:hypothetical protein
LVGGFIHMIVVRSFRPFGNCISLDLEISCAPVQRFFDERLALLCGVSGLVIEYGNMA